jgi:hypothetical protein
MNEQTPTIFCADQGISRQTLSRWRHAGLVKVTAGGLIDAEATEAALRDAGRGQFRAKAASPPEGGLAEEQRKKEIALARLRRHEWLRRSAGWVPCAEAEGAWSVLAEHVRGRIQELPQAIAAAVAGCSDMAQMRTAIREVVYAALTELSETEYRGTEPDWRGTLPEVPSGATKLAAQTAKEAALARLRQLDADIAAGALVNLEAFLEALGDAFSRVRTRLLGLEAFLPPRLIGAPTAERERIIRGAVHDALNELPDTAGSLLQSSIVSGDDENDDTAADQAAGRSGRGQGPRPGKRSHCGRKPPGRK